MKQIRYSIFETNSSSTHTISICRIPLPKKDIPYNQHIILKLNKFLNEDINESEEVLYKTQLGKLEFIINILVCFIIDHVNIININDDTNLYEYKYDNKDKYIETYDDLININCFDWVREVVFDITRSTFDIDEDCIGQIFPFIENNYNYIHLDDPTIIKLFKDIEKKNEEDFKMIIRTIIFDEKATISEKIYYDGYNWVTYSK